MRGLDPRIHPSLKESLKKMDCRVKPGNDDFCVMRGLDPRIHPASEESFEDGLPGQARQ
jgi:hypothetical protein